MESAHVRVCAGLVEGDLSRFTWFHQVYVGLALHLDRVREVVVGLEDVANEGRVWAMEGGSPAARWFRLSLDHLRTRLVGVGKLTDDEVDRMLVFFEDPHWSALSPIIMSAWGRRPG